jgi:NDP-sugar pyrophosphorylase family protein
MQSFNSKLEVGMQAMVIGCKQPKNSWVIGKMVTIEALCQKGENVPDEFLSEQFKAEDSDRTPFLSNVAIVRGIHVNTSILFNHAVINEMYLMPLPPLDDDAIIFANENVKETEKCS